VDCLAEVGTRRVHPEFGPEVFCLVDAPSTDAAHAVHREAHGLVADEIYPVVQG